MLARQGEPVLRQENQLLLSSNLQASQHTVAKLHCKLQSTGTDGGQKGMIPTYYLNRSYIADVLQRSNEKQQILSAVLSMLRHGCTSSAGGRADIAEIL